MKALKAAEKCKEKSLSHGIESKTNTMSHSQHFYSQLESSPFSQHQSGLLVWQPCAWLPSSCIHDTMLWCHTLILDNAAFFSTWDSALSWKPLLVSSPRLEDPVELSLSADVWIFVRRCRFIWSKNNSDKLYWDFWKQSWAATFILMNSFA